MPEKKQESFTVTDRRLFTSEGELRKTSEEEVQTAPPTPEPPPPAKPPIVADKRSEAAAAGVSTARPSTASGDEPPMPPAPTAAEQQAQADAYRMSSKDLDTRVELSGHSAKELEMTFERFMASLYMTAMMQLGLMHEEGGRPRVDLIGGRQTIDTLTLLAEKTKGNLSSAEDTFLQNCLYELRMAYVEVTNALARPPQPPPKAAGIV
jgi:hypothetical protein